MKLGFVLSNYKAKLQIEIKALTKKKQNNGFFLKFINNLTLRKQIREKQQLLEYIDNYIRELEKKDIARLNKNIQPIKIDRNLKKVSDLEQILNKL